VADIPGIIEGAHQGKGLGDRFLQHVERTRVLAYLVPVDSHDPQATYDLLRAEAHAYSPELGKKQHVVVLTKTDLLPDEGVLPSLDAPQAVDVVSISSVANKGLMEMKECFWRLVAGVSESHTKETLQLP
jgi:GTP-binding protein